MPSKETTEKVFDFLDVSRGVETFLSGMTAASVYGMLESYKDAGMRVNDLGMFEDLLDARSVFLTPNTSTPYGTMEIDVKDGPIVVVVPPNVLGHLRVALVVPTLRRDPDAGHRAFFVGQRRRQDRPLCLHPLRRDPRFSR